MFLKDRHDIPLMNVTMNTNKIESIKNIVFVHCFIADFYLQQTIHDTFKALQREMVIDIHKYFFFQLTFTI